VPDKEHGATPLHVAARWATLETVVALFDVGADPKARDRDGRLPADFAVDNEQVKNHDVFRILNQARPN